MRTRKPGQRAKRGPAREDVPGREGPSARPCVLVVDDDREITHLLAAVLRQWDYAALEANGAAEAIRIAGRETIDAALIDVWMPGEGGFPVLQALKKNDPHLVAVMMTGYADLEGARRAMRLGAYDYVTKPFDTDALRAILAAGLRERADARGRGARKAASSSSLTAPRR